MVDGKTVNGEIVRWYDNKMMDGKMIDSKMVRW